MRSGPADGGGATTPIRARKDLFTRFLGVEPDRLHFAAHSHHPWPDASLEGQRRYWLDSAAEMDRKWDRILGELPQLREFAGDRAFDQAAVIDGFEADIVIRKDGFEAQVVVLIRMSNDGRVEIETPVSFETAIQEIAHIPPLAGIDDHDTLVFIAFRRDHHCAVPLADIEENYLKGTLLRSMVFFYVQRTRVWRVWCPNDRQPADAESIAGRILVDQ